MQVQIKKLKKELGKHSGIHSEFEKALHLAEQRRSTAESKYLKLKSVNIDMETKIKSLSDKLQLYKSEVKKWRGLTQEAK